MVIFGWYSWYLAGIGFTRLYLGGIGGIWAVFVLFGCILVQLVVGGVGLSWWYLDGFCDIRV